MKDRYDFSKGKRGRVLPPQPEPEGKTRITIRLDQELVDRFFEMAEQSGGANGYQTLINAALREYLEGKAPRFEDTLRRIHSRGTEASCSLIQLTVSVCRENGIACNAVFRNFIYP